MRHSSGRSQRSSTSVLGRVGDITLRGVRYAVAYTFLAPSAFARIDDPSSRDLLCASPNVVIGQAIAIVPTPTSPWVVVFVSIILSLIVVRYVPRRRRPLVKALTGVVCLAVSTVGGILLAAPASFFLPQAIAVVRVTDNVNGTSHHFVPVAFGTAFVCDLSTIRPEREYLLFLRGEWPFQRLSWYDWSVWQISAGNAQNERREWRGMPPLPLTLFRNAVRQPQLATRSLAE
jgi:hypothetical protein